MEPVRNFDELLARFRSMPERKRVAVVCPEDEHTLSVARTCLADGLADLLLISSGRASASTARTLAAEWPDRAVYLATSSVDEAAALGVRLVREGRADVLMKGNINTDNLLRAILAPEGLLPKGSVMSHVAAADIPSFGRMLLFSDAAVIPAPDLGQFDAMLRYDLAVARRLGIAEPRVALVHFTEKVNAKFPCTTSYVELLDRASRGIYGPVRIGGPMDVKTACDPHSGEVKGITSPVGGEADILLFPDLEASNTFYKTLPLFAGARMAGIVTGTSAPVVVPSRADSTESKLLSLALACVAGA